MSPERTYTALTSGIMKQVGDTLNEIDRRRVSHVRLPRADVLEDGLEIIGFDLEQRQVRKTAIAI